VSRPPARHQKSRRQASPRPGAHARHQKPSPIASALAHKPTRIAAAVAGSTLVVSAAVAPALTHWTGSGPRTTALDQAGGPSGSLPSARASQPDAPRAESSAASTATPPDQASARARAGATATAHPPARHVARHRRPAPQVAAAPVYGNPLRGISGLIPERVDMGADFGGTGPIYALGNGVVTSAMTNAGWPGGGWITYRLTDGPAAGLMVYVAEDVTPSVQVGQAVTSSTVVASMFNGGAGIETGWAQPDGSSAESQLSEAGGISGGGPFPTEIGLNFEALLQAVGVPAGPNSTGAPNGTLPQNYPTNWAAAARPR
jgi:hypothetical protein